MDFITNLLLYFALCLAIARWADMWRHTAFGFFLLSVILSPLVAVIILMMAGNPRRECGECKEYVLQHASKCPYCQSAIDTQAPPTVSDPSLG